VKLVGKANRKQESRDRNLNLGEIRNVFHWDIPTWMNFEIDHVKTATLPVKL